MPVRCKHVAILAVGIALISCVAVPAQAGIIGMSMSGGDISSLYLPDGTWDEGPTGDWYYTISPDTTYGTAWLRETWIAGNPVDFNMGVEADSDPNVRIVKTLDNDTDFDWTDFHIRLVPQPGTGPIVVDPLSVDSDRFTDTLVTNNPDGSAIVEWFTNFGAGDTPVLIGEEVTLDFTFNVPGSVAFKMVQTPTPEPASLALVLLGGLAVVRRRR